MEAPLELAFTVACPPEHAFSVWTERTSLWWPASHSVSADPGLSVTFEPRAGGRIFERTASGEEHDWGRIVEWEPPRRLVYRWHLRQDREDATRVEISFAPADGGTPTGRSSASASATSAAGPGCSRASWPLVPAVRPSARIFGPAAPSRRRARAVAWRGMEKPKPSAPPTHRRYPRSLAKPPARARAETARRWPRAIPDRRLFPRG